MEFPVHLRLSAVVAIFDCPEQSQFIVFDRWNKLLCSRSGFFRSPLLANSTPTPHWAEPCSLPPPIQEGTNRGGLHFSNWNYRRKYGLNRLPRDPLLNIDFKSTSSPAKKNTWQGCKSEWKFPWRTRISASKEIVHIYVNYPYISPENAANRDLKLNTGLGDSNHYKDNHDSNSCSMWLHTVTRMRPGSRC